MSDEKKRMESRISITPLEDQPEAVKDALAKGMAQHRQMLIENGIKDLLRNADPNDPEAEFQRELAREYATELVDRVLN